MLSINMRVFKTVLIVAFFGASVRCLPVADKPTGSKIESEIKTEIVATSVVPQEIDVTTAAPTSRYPDTTDFYDQRQNGSENYRIHVDGFVVVLAPVEALLLAGAAGAAAGSAGTTEVNFSISNEGASPIQPIGEPDKPAVDGIHNKTDLAISKTIHRQPAVRLANFLAPLIRGIRHVRGTSVH
ncbi:uncharacterized protein LOC112463117 [Temnothorax curvispinosus]|uniref:Uncharacterized protein LOC112463117 n=1 Tax=Temnothorax curvispinosus TaxID=300111 RepID=A0A6J1QWQ6_9HYME|nr:uncharacterized protein LOC112463117 [Temnothorax curvispinosus]